MQIALDAQKDPQQVQMRDGAWLKAWVDDVPDLTLNASPLAIWLKIAPQATIREAVGFQYMASVMAFQIQHPNLVDQQPANDLAGMEGVLRAYEVLVRKDLAHRSAKLDLALAPAIKVDCQHPPYCRAGQE